MQRHCTEPKMDIILSQATLPCDGSLHIFNYIMFYHYLLHARAKGLSVGILTVCLTKRCIVKSCSHPEHLPLDLSNFSVPTSMVKYSTFNNTTPAQADLAPADNDACKAAVVPAQAPSWVDRWDAMASGPVTVSCMENVEPEHVICSWH